MSLDNVISLSSSVAAAAAVIYAGWHRGTGNVWREEAEAQKARADRLEDDLGEIKERLTRIEAENQRLIELLTALDPERLRALRI
jgi:Fe-S cluster assembly scaffold protein SufB